MSAHRGTLGWASLPMRVKALDHGTVQVEIPDGKRTVVLVMSEQTADLLACDLFAAAKASRDLDRLKRERPAGTA